MGDESKIEDGFEEYLIEDLKDSEEEEDEDEDDTMSEEYG